MPKKKIVKTPKKPKLAKKNKLKTSRVKKNKFSFKDNLNNKLFSKIKVAYKSNDKIKTVTGLFLIIIGFFLLNTYINIHSPKTSLDFKNSTKKTIVKAEVGSIQVDPKLMKDENVSEEPIRVVIPSANIDLNVTEAPVVDGYWETSEIMASHGMGSANPGQGGNSVIFGHARVGLFYNLIDLKKDDIVYVFTSKKWFAYKITDITSVFPNQIEVIAPTKDQRLTLYTCTGYADEKRLIVVAKPLKI